ncbi:SRPBCC domain-containing protein [Amycolatopsis sp. NPDC054798]
MDDMDAWLGAAERETGEREIGGQAGCSVRIRRSFSAPVKEVWAACTTRSRIDTWFLPVTGELRVGGTYQLESYAEGEITRCEAPGLLSVTMAIHGAPGEAQLRLRENSAGGTVLEFEHTMVADAAMWSAIAPEIGSAWEVALKYLDRHLRGDQIDKSTFPTPEDDELGSRCKKEWTAVVSG